MKLRLLILFLFPFFLLSCKKFEYSPYQLKPTGDAPIPLKLNSGNMEKLQQSTSTADDTVTFLYVGDSQRFYEELDDLVAKANSIPSLDFLVLAGDITDFGLLQEFEWIQKRLERLRIPYFCAIGNHDLTAQGARIYEKMFGQRNFAFNYLQYKFLFHDTNGREHNFDGTAPDIPWLAQQMEDQMSKWFVGISHVPPYDVDFDKNLEKPYSSLFRSNPNFILSLHGHLHTTLDAFAYNDHVRYIVCNAIDSREAVVIQLIQGNIIKQTITY